MEEFSRHRDRQAALFLLVCAIHGVLGWFLLATSRVMTLTNQARGFELLWLPPAAQLPAPTASAAKQQSAAPRRVDRPPRSIVNQEKAAAPSAQSNETTPPVDWNAELVQAARATASNAVKIPTKNFGFPTRSPTIKDFPQFDWDYARTHRVESFPEGGILVHLNDNCVLLLNPFPFPLCSPVKRKANGELFKHMHDSDKPSDAGIP